MKFITAVAVHWWFFELFREIDDMDGIKGALVHADVTADAEFFIDCGFAVIGFLDAFAAFAVDGADPDAEISSTA